uniref:Uncharacterized protein n=1 Tax=Eutreptiella gymnastica TaxID=73025 RepID=A0A7S1ID85_9EUGL
MGQTHVNKPKEPLPRVDPNIKQSSLPPYYQFVRQQQQQQDQARQLAGQYGDKVDPNVAFAIPLSQNGHQVWGAPVQAAPVYGQPPMVYTQPPYKQV